MIIDKINKNDILKFAFQWIFSGIVGSFLCYFTSGTPEKIFICLLVIMLYTLCFAFSYQQLLINEKDGFKFHRVLNKSTIWYCILLLLCSIGHLLPQQIQFYLLSGAILCIILPKHLGIAQGIMIVSIIQLCGKTDIYDCIFSILLMLLGMLCSDIFQKRKYSFESVFIIGGISIGIYFLCNYCKGNAISSYMVLHGLLEGLMNLGILIFAVPHLHSKKVEEISISYGEAIEDDFPLVQFLKSVSDKQYQHGRLVSNLCFKCCKEIGLNENLACCAGLYYSLNSADSHNSTELVLELSEQYNLPAEVRRLLQEYHGISSPISTPEAAVVDLIDEVVLRIEEYGKEYLAGFNRQMLIINTFEELSASGRYDYSGLSINMFLKVRKYLIEEAEF